MARPNALVRDANRAVNNYADRNRRGGRTAYEKNKAYLDSYRDASFFGEEGENTFDKYDAHIAGGGDEYRFSDPRLASQFKEALGKRDAFIQRAVAAGVSEEEARQEINARFGNIGKDSIGGFGASAESDIDAWVRQRETDSSVAGRKDARDAQRKLDQNRTAKYEWESNQAAIKANQTREDLINYRAQRLADKMAKDKALEEKNRPESLSSRLNKLAYEAQGRGYKNVTAESMQGRFDKAMQKAQADYDAGVKSGRIDPHTMRPTEESVLESMQSNLDRNAKNRPAMLAQREAQKNANMRMRRETFKDLGGSIGFAAGAAGGRGGSAMSEAQIAAKARWDAKREANSANYHKGAANNQYQGYMTGPQYGRDVYTEMQKQWGTNGRTQLTPGGAAYNYAQALDYNRRLQEANLRSINAQAQLAQNQAGVINGLVPAVNNTKPGGTPTQSDLNAVAATPMTTDQKKQTI